ncbi:MAG: flagellar motor protein MotB [Planctomycetota bacterium]|nr:MAG: flagellar motor protein MotB [Planctomycetota bacterium]
MGKLNPPDEGGGGAPEWVLTFGDMMSLLLTFFIMLAAMSEVKKEDEFQAMAEAFRKRFGKYVALDDLAVYYKPTVATPLKSTSKGREKKAKTLKGASRTEGPAGEDMRVRSIRPGDDPTIGGVIQFTEGTDAMAADADDALKKIVATIAGKPQKIEIRGHTSARPLPPDSPYKDHYDLAYARCREVAQKLVEMGIDERRIRISVAGPNEPLHIDHDPKKRELNARIEIYMLNELTQDLQGTPDEQQDRSATLPGS